MIGESFPVPGKSPVPNIDLSSFKIIILEFGTVGFVKTRVCVGYDTHA